MKLRCVIKLGHTWYVPDAGTDWCRFGLKGQPRQCPWGPFEPTYGGTCGYLLYSEIVAAEFDECLENVTMSNIGYMVKNESNSHYAQGTWISYTGPQSVQAIIEFAKVKNLRGAFAYDICGDIMPTFNLTQEIAKLEQQ